MSRYHLCILPLVIMLLASAALAMRNDTSEPGRTLGKCRKEDFEELGVIGCGMSGVVFLTRHPATQRLFAMKRIPKALIQQNGSISDELRLLKSLRGIPLVVQFYCSMDDSNYQYLVVEFCQGGELFELIVRKGRFPERHAKFYAASIVLALEQLHERGIVYRDLKSQNVLLTGTGHVRLTDVGLSKELAVGERTSSLVGTPEYLAPEMFNCPDYAHPVDWWALGVVIYEMLFAKRPYEFQDGDGPARWEQVINRRVHVGADVSLSAQRIIRDLLHATPEFRLGFRGAHEVKRHEWFADVDWDALAEGELPPPFVPPVSDPLDRSCFDIDWVRRNLDDAHNESLFKDF